MNRNLYLRKIRNLRDQVDMLLMESGPQRLLQRELTRDDVSVIEGEINRNYFNRLIDILKICFERGDPTVFNELKEQTNKIIGDRTGIEKDIDSFCETVQNSSLATPKMKMLFKPVLLKQLNNLDKYLDKLIVDKDGKASSEALTIIYAAGLGCIILSVIIGMLIKPDLKGDISRIKDAFRNQEWLKLLELIVKDLLKYGVIALPAILGLVYIVMAVLEQFSDFKIISAISFFIKRSIIAPLLAHANDITHDE